MIQDNYWTKKIDTGTQLGNIYNSMDDVYIVFPRKDYVYWLNDRLMCIG